METGRRVTRSLFYEGWISYRPNVTPKWTLEYEDRETPEFGVLPSIYKVYMAVGDPTEYEFTQAANIPWDVWISITGNKDLMVYIQRWRDELDAKIRSETLKKARAAVESGTASAAVLKYVTSKEYEGVERQTVGRPKKPAKVKPKDDFDKDAERLGLKMVVNNVK